MEIKKITINLDLGQVCNDVLAKCYQVSLNLQDDAQKDIRANIESPDSTETKSIINRSITEAVGNLKIACQRYLTTGRTVDNNNLERIVKSKSVYGDEVMEYEVVTLNLEIPNFNIAVTDGLKSHMHRYIVDYVMSQFLADQYADKASQYAESVGADYGNIQSDLLSRDNYIHRRASWT